MAKKPLKKCLIVLTIQEMQIKSTLRFYLTLTSRAQINNASDISCKDTCSNIQGHTHREKHR